MDINGVEALLYSTHLMLSSLTSVPELALDKEEAKQLAVSVKAVADLYDVPMLSAEAFAWMALVQTTAIIYGPRIVAVRLRRAGERAEREAAQSASELNPLPPGLQGGM